jgi:hypothetical protein
MVVRPVTDFGFGRCSTNATQGEVFWMQMPNILSGNAERKAAEKVYGWVVT